MLLDWHLAASVVARLIRSEQRQAAVSLEGKSAGGAAATALKARAAAGAGTASRPVVAGHHRKKPWPSSARECKAVYAVIAQLQQDGFRTSMRCQVLGVHGSAYYAWQRGRIRERPQEDAELASDSIHPLASSAALWRASDCAELLHHGRSCGVVRVGCCGEWDFR
jgi:hypothetical protein